MDKGSHVPSPTQRNATKHFAQMGSALGAGLQGPRSADIAGPYGGRQRSATHSLPQATSYGRPLGSMAGQTTQASGLPSSGLKSTFAGTGLPEGEQQSQPLEAYSSTAEAANKFAGATGQGKGTVIHNNNTSADIYQVIQNFNTTPLDAISGLNRYENLDGKANRDPSIISNFNSEQYSLAQFQLNSDQINRQLNKMAADFQNGSHFDSNAAAMFQPIHRASHEMMAPGLQYARLKRPSQDSSVSVRNEISSITQMLNRGGDLAQQQQQVMASQQGSYPLMKPAAQPEEQSLPSMSGLGLNHLTNEDNRRRSGATLSAGNLFQNYQF